MPAPFRFAICNELFRGLSLAQTCKAVRDIGYTGLEIAPFTLAENAATLSPQDRSDIRKIIGRHDLSFVGLHWLLASPPSLNAVTADPEQRARTWKFLDDLVDLAADLASAASSVLVFGSPKQRSTDDEIAREQATQFLAEGLGRLAPHAQERDVVILLEPLSADQCDVVNSIEEAVRIVEQIDSPAIQTMFDVHNAVDESLPHPELIRQFLPHIRHIHLNEMDGSAPGARNYNFANVLTTLSELNYRGWISLEIFDFEHDPLLVARNAFDYLEQAASPRRIAQTL